MKWTQFFLFILLLVFIASVKGGKKQRRQLNKLQDSNHHQIATNEILTKSLESRELEFRGNWGGWVHRESPPVEGKKKKKKRTRNTQKSKN